MKKQLFDDLLKSIEEAGEIGRGEKHAPRAMRYAGKVLVEILEHGKTVWRLEDAAEALAERPDAARSPKEIREALNQTQEGFAALLSISVDTLQGWEQGRREPRGPAQTLLRIAARDPVALLAVHQETQD